MCPSVDNFDLAFATEVDIQVAVRDLLLDPGSYQQRNITANKLDARLRDDGSKYYGTVTVNFRAKNAFGGMMPGSARVTLDEDPDGGCMVRRATLIE